MIKETALVIAINANKVTVESAIKSACSGCQQVDNCGSGQVAKAFPQRKLTLTIETNLSVQLGDNVIIGLSEQDLLRSAWQVYFWPLLGLIFAAFIGQGLVEKQMLHEFFAIILSGVGGYFGFLLARYQQNKQDYCHSLRPTILEVVTKHIEIVEITG